MWQNWDSNVGLDDPTVHTLLGGKHVTLVISNDTTNRVKNQVTD